MIISYEIPTPNLKDLGKYNDYSFCLAHLALQDKAYVAYYKNAPGYKIVDNSIFELDHALPYADVMKAAGILRANEVVSPDSFQNSAKTIKATEDFLKYFSAAGLVGKYKVMGVVQGSNIPSWVKCFTWMDKNPLIDVIGISYVGCASFSTEPTDSRVKAVKYAIDHIKPTKPLHLLGIGGNPMEVALQKTFSQVRSCDTSIPVVDGYYNVRYDMEKGSNILPKNKRPSDYFNLTLNSSQLTDANFNMQCMRKWTT